MKPPPMRKRICSPIPPFECTPAEWLVLIGAAMVGFFGMMLVFNYCL